MARENNYTACLIVNLWLFWVLIWVCSGTAAVNTVMATWNRFQTSPTVISMERNFSDFPTTMPAMTICFNGLLNKTRAGIFIDKKWGNLTSEKKSYYHDFLQSIANVSYGNMENFQKFINDSSIPRDGYYSILNEISMDFPALASWYTKTPPNLGMSLTDRGNCYTVNSAFRIDRLRRGNGKYSRGTLVLNDTAKIRYPSMEGELSASQMKSAVTIYPHSPLESSDVNDYNDLALPLHLGVTFFQVTELTSTEEVADLGIKQRQCRFPHESNLIVSPLYSYTHCRLQCRMQLAVKLCGCSPYFYPLIDGFTECAIEQLPCISKHKDSIRVLLDPETGLPDKSCKCTPTCDFVAYSISKKLVATWSQGSRYMMGIRTPRMQLRRSVLYGPTDLLVSFGGTLGLFLGCSLLSLAEVIYFFTLKLVKKLSRH